MHCILSFPILLSRVCSVINCGALGADSSTNEGSCAQPSPQEMAKAAGITLPKLPWHVVNIWWDFEKPTEHFESLAVDVTIDRLCFVNQPGQWKASALAKEFATSSFGVRAHHSNMAM